jgi:serine/threonine protein kinase
VIGGLEPGDPPLIGPYRLVGRLGCGGMGRVFLGLSAGGRPVAVKVIRAELAADSEFRVRFGREVTAARRVSGLFTALVVDADVEGPVPWLATAYVPGPSLSEAVTGYGPMSSRSAMALAAGLAEGLSAIHAASVVHCDLKPSNVLLSQDGPRVIDFGISRAAEAVSVTGASLVAGSPGFMSPEQAEGYEVGPPSDVFSLGAVLAFAATGRGPFGEGVGPELAYRVVYGQPDLGRLPDALRPLVEHCLVKDPGQRPTARELLAEVAALQSATGWLPDSAVGAFSEYFAPSPVVLPSAASAPGHAADGPGLVRPGPGRDRGPRGRNSRGRASRLLAVTGVAASLIAASAVAGFALSGAAKHQSAMQFQPRAAAVRASLTPGPAMPAPVFPDASPSPKVTSRGPVPAEIVPAADTVTSPAPPRETSTSPSAPASPSRSKRPVVPASSTASPSTSPSASPTPSPSASPTPALAVPLITSTGTYQQGIWVYFEIRYADPGQDAQGFGFTGSDGKRWVEGSHPFSSPGRGITGPDSIAYPLNLECGTAKQHKAEIEAWIYDIAGISSQPVVIDLSCTD